jgi:hypothetical protein
VVFVLDRSLSMGLRDAFQRARREVLAYLGQLPPTARFQVIAYNRQAEPLFGNALLTAEPGTLQRVRSVLEALPPKGSTDHGNALRRGLLLRPDVLYFVTDANDLNLKEVLEATRSNQWATAIHVISFNPQRDPPAHHPLRQLASLNQGSFRHVGPQ